VVARSAAVQERDGAALALDKSRNGLPQLELVWADNGYNAHLVNTAVAEVPSLRMPLDSSKSTFSWFGLNRPPAKDRKNLAETLYPFVILASIQIAIRRLVR